MSSTSLMFCQSTWPWHTPYSYVQYSSPMTRGCIQTRLSILCSIWKITWGVHLFPSMKESWNEWHKQKCIVMGKTEFFGSNTTVICRKLFFCSFVEFLCGRLTNLSLWLTEDRMPELNRILKSHFTRPLSFRS